MGIGGSALTKEQFDERMARALRWRELETEWDCAYMQRHCDRLDSGLEPEEDPYKVEGRLTGNPYTATVLMP